MHSARISPATRRRGSARRASTIAATFVAGLVGLIWCARGEAQCPLKPPGGGAPIPTSAAPFATTHPAIAGEWSYLRFGESLYLERPTLVEEGLFQEFGCGPIAALPRWPFDKSSGGSGAAMLSVLRVDQAWPQASVVIEWHGPIVYDYFQLRWGPDQAAAFPYSWNSPMGAGGKVSFTVKGPQTFGFRIAGCSKTIGCPLHFTPPVWVDVHPFVLAAPLPSPPGPSLVPQFVPGELAVHEPDDGGRWLPGQQEALRDHICSNVDIRLISDKEGHEGELESLRVLAMLQTAKEEDASFKGCGNMTRQEIHAAANQAIRDATVESQVGTDLDALVRYLFILVPALVTTAIAAWIWGPVAAGATFVITFILSLFSIDRPGDYDMNLMGLLQIAYRYEDQLETETKCDILRDLLTVHGEADDLDETLDINILPTPIDETENHVLMIQSARYLSNNLYKRWAPSCPKVEQPDDIDNDPNGMTDWWLERLQQLLIADFYEFSSRPYSDHSLLAIRNLHEFSISGPLCKHSKGGSPDPAYVSRCNVRRAARNVLDYAAARFALSSNNFRRAAPFRRLPEQRGYTRLLGRESDRVTTIHLPYSADSPIVRMQGGRLNEGMISTLLSGTQSSYTPSYVITDLMSDLSKAPYTLAPVGDVQWLQRFRVTERETSTPEVYYRDLNFLISAGGVFDDGADWASWTDSEDAWPLPTTLMPTAEGVDLRDLVRIQGSWEQDSRINLCVTRGFACGLNPIVPLGIPSQCRHEDGDWIFIDMDANTAGCPLDYGFYVAVLRKACDSDPLEPCEGDDVPDDDESREDFDTQRGKDAFTYGFFEAMTYARPFMSYVAEVLAKNDSSTFKWGQENVYLSPSKREIRFELGELDEDVYPIVSVTEPGKPVLAIERKTGRWPLAAAEATLSGGEVKSYEKYPGCVTVDNTRMMERLILDLSDGKQPKRTRVYLPSECNCPVRFECLPLRLE